MADKAEYEKALASGDIDIWMDAFSNYEDEQGVLYKLTDPYLSTTVSMLQRSDATGRAKKIAILQDNIVTRQVAESKWPEAELVEESSLDDCMQAVLNGKVDGALLKTYTAQQVARKDSLNRLRTSIVPGAYVELQMGVNAQDSHLFYSLWDKTLTQVASQYSAEVVQKNVDTGAEETLIRYLYTHPGLFVTVVILLFAAVLFLALYLQSTMNEQKQKKAAAELADALEEARKANEAKQNFFSKMSHDIRTPMNVVLGDASRVSQIIINIVSNAIKYTEAGGRIDLRLETLPNDRFRFTCADNGIGMSEEFVRHIGEDYLRAEDSRISKTEGTGLGMSVVKGFTERMNGQLTVRSKLGEGSVFEVELPLPPASEEQRQAVLHPAAERLDAKKFAGREVLLVEDNTLNAEIAIELLKTIGLEVDWAENGKLGVEKFEASFPGQYFAVFMDMQMPVMDGLEAAKCIRNSTRPDHTVPIFALTANTFSSDRDRCKEVGMNGYIAKPVSVKDIQAAVSEITTSVPPPRKISS